MTTETSESIKQQWLEGRLPSVDVVQPEPVGLLEPALPVGPRYLHLLLRRSLARLSPGALDLFVIFMLISLMSLKLESSLLQSILMTLPKNRTEICGFAVFVTGLVGNHQGRVVSDWFNPVPGCSQGVKS